MSPNTFTLRILRFHNCEGCVRKVGVVLHQIDGVELVEFNPVSGNLTVSTTRHPEVIKEAIERKTKRKVVIVSQEINHRHQDPITLPPQSTINVQDLAETLLRVSQAEGLHIVELVGDLNSNSFRLSFNQHLPDFGSSANYIGDSENELFPPAATRSTLEPSSASQHFSATANQVPVYGYPSEFYGMCTTCGRDHTSKCCTIM